MNVDRGVAELLADAGIKFRTMVDCGKTWHYCEICPCCAHADDGCGIAEWRDENRLLHSVTCHHPQDNPWKTSDPDYMDVLGRITQAKPGSMPVRWQPHRSSSSTVTMRSRRLRQNSAALAWLRLRGIEDVTIDRFGLGLSEVYSDRQDGLKRCNALTYPVLDNTGEPTSRFGYYNIPGVTENPVDANHWMAGEPRTCFSGRAADASMLLVVDGCKDLWVLAQQLEHWQMHGIVLCTSSHGMRLPREWQEQAFWSGHASVLVGTDMDPAGDRLATKIAQFSGPGTRRIVIPLAGRSHGADGRPVKDWTDWLTGDTADAATFQAMLDGAETIDKRCARGVARDDPAALGVDEEDLGQSEYSPLNVQSAYHGGHLYYCAHVLRRKRIIDKEGQDHIAEGVETVVVRSDRTQHHAQAMPAIPGGGGRPVFRLLPDGAVLEAKPAVSQFCTWTWKSISNYLAGNEQPRPLADMLGDIEKHIMSRVWLPHPEMYAVLAAAVAVTFCQSIFDAVPLFLILGPAGSGKSQLGRALHQLCANSIFVGQTTAATVARQVDASRGGAILDDLEGIGTTTRDGSYTEFIQALKLSYSKSTATKAWTDPRTFQVSVLNFFGVKFLSNTQGTDEILGSRMLQISTRRLTRDKLTTLGGLPPPPDKSTDSLRQELHTWAFANVAAIATCYAAISETFDRKEEIVAPLRVIAELAEDEVFSERLELGVAGCAGKAVDPENPADNLVAAARRLVQLGFRHVCPTHLRLELTKYMDPTYGRESISAIPVWRRADWIGKQMRANGIVDRRIEGQRRRPAAGGSALHVYAFDREFIAETEASGPCGPEVEPMSWCLTDHEGGCAKCSYLAVGCDLSDRRVGRKAGALQRPMSP